MAIALVAAWSFGAAKGIAIANVVKGN